MSSRPLSILLIDDNPADRMLTARELAHEFPDVEIEQVFDREGLDGAVQRGGFDLIITDFHLRWSDGLHIVSEVRDRFPLIPIIMFTGTGNEQIAVEAMKAGLDDYIVKAPQHFRRLRTAARMALDRAAQRRAMRLAEERYRKLFDDVPIGIYQMSLDGRFIHANPALLQMLGAANLDELVSAFPERFAAESFQPNWPPTAFDDRRDDHVFEMPMRRLDGDVIFVRVTDRLIRNAQGQPLYHEGIAEDISDRRHREEQLRLLVAAIDGADEALVITDADLEPPGPRISFVNRGFERMTGYSAVEVIGRSPRLLQGPATDRRVLEQMKAQLQAGRVCAGSTVNYRKDGTAYHVEWNIAPIRDADGRVTHFLSVQRDVTQRVQMEDQVRQSQKLEAVGQLASGIAHDFNNMLTVIFGNCSLAKAALAPENPAFAALEQIELAAQQASGITRALLTFACRTPTEKRPVDLRTEVREAALMLQRLLPAGVTLHIDDSGPPAIAVADRTQVQQIILNLAVNARDAMPRGGTLRIGLLPPANKVPMNVVEESATPVPMVGIRVQDDGEGIAAESLSRIFDPFFTTKPRGKGTGLGLAVVHGIVTDHGGRIEVESAAGEQTTFSIWLPRSEHVPDVVDSEGVVAPPRGRGELILLAEDHSYVREIIAAALTAAGYEVTAVRDGNELMNAYRDSRDRLRLMVFDIDLPKRSGLDCLREIRAAGDATPAMIITGAASIAEHELHDPRTIVMHKPFPIPELVRTAARIIARGSAAAPMA